MGYPKITVHKLMVLSISCYDDPNYIIIYNNNYIIYITIMIYNSDYIIYIIMHNYNDNYQSDIFPLVHGWPPNDLPSLRATQHCLHPSHPASSDHGAAIGMRQCYGTILL